MQNKRDGSGLEYRRNRQYDPASGRFTQEDPIGLAGGLNLYGFANGDPVNFSDPFGLCEPWPECASGAVASAGFLDPLAYIGGMAGGLRAIGARATTTVFRAVSSAEVASIEGARGAFTTVAA